MNRRSPPPSRVPSERALRRLLARLNRPPSATVRQALAAFIDIKLAEVSDGYVAFGLGFETALNVMTQEPELLRWFAERFRAETVAEFDTPPEALAREARADAGDFVALMAPLRSRMVPAAVGGSPPDVDTHRRRFL